MAEVELKKRTKEAYESILSMFDEMDFHYELQGDDDVEYKVIHFTVSGEDIPMEIYIDMDEECQIMSLISPMPVHFNESNITDAYVLVGKINSMLKFGSFKVDSDGDVIFQFTHFFIDSLISKEAWQFMIHLCFYVIDEYNDKLLMFSKGLCDMDTVLARKN